MAPSDGPTTASVRRYLDALGGDTPAEPIVRALLERSVRRLEMLCGSLLHRAYPRLARPPMNLHTDDLLSAVVERLLKALRSVKPETVRQFFALANQHIRWELNDLARRLDDRPAEVELPPGLHQSGPQASHERTDPGPSPRQRRILAAIEELPEPAREVFDLVRIQGLTHAETAEVVGVSTKTIQRRLHESLLLLADHLGDLRPADEAPS